MKNKTVLAMTYIIIMSGIFTGCGTSKKTETAEQPKTTPIAVTEQVSTKKEVTMDLQQINVTANEGWNADSTPAILHIKSQSVEIYHAVHPDEGGGAGTTAIELAEGKYDIEFISPLNHDGSAYEIYEMGAKQEITIDVDYDKDMTVTCEMKQIPADKVTDEMIQKIVEQTQIAIEKGDDSLKGEAGKTVLEHLAVNVANSPNASEATKDMANAVKEETKVSEVTAENTAVENTRKELDVTANEHTDVVTSGTNDVKADLTPTEQAQTAPTEQAGTTGQPAGQTGTTSSATGTTGQTTQPTAPVQSTPVESLPAHVHTWVNHTATKQEWVANIVTVPDYETQTTYVWVCNCGAVIADDGEMELHVMNHCLNGEPENGTHEQRTTTVQVGSHTEDQGHYETVSYTDYQYCTGCGEKK